MVSHLALNIDTLCHTFGREFKPQWWQTLCWIQAKHLHFYHDSIGFIWFTAIICHSNLSWELWNRKLKNNQFILKSHVESAKHQSVIAASSLKTGSCILETILESQEDANRVIVMPPKKSTLAFIFSIWAFHTTTTKKQKKLFTEQLLNDKYASFSSKRF